MVLEPTAPNYAAGATLCAVAGGCAASVRAVAGGPTRFLSWDNSTKVLSWVLAVAWPAAQTRVLNFQLTNPVQMQVRQERASVVA